MARRPGDSSWHPSGRRGLGFDTFPGRLCPKAEAYRSFLNIDGGTIMNDVPGEEVDANSGLVMVVDFSFDEAIDDGALADSAVPQEHNFVLLVGQAAAVEL